MPESSSSSNKRIAKNTLLLYARMLYSLFISLFTARVILNALGFEDYGLYNVIGSIVSMFVFLRSAMGNSVHRYITYSIGKGNFDDVKKVFSISIIIFTGLALLIVLLCETVGLWFFYEKLNIPEGRMTAALWVYQFSIITIALSVICVPYDAIIIAHERMNVFAYVQILNATLNLGIVYLVASYPYDKLIFYAFLLMLIQVMNRLIYGIYCGRHFPETKFRMVKDKKLLKEMISFAGWKLFGNMMVVANTQGVNILLNLFFGTVINAARGIAVQVDGAVSGFVTNFQLAVRPQITKSYAASEGNRLKDLMVLSSKFSYFLLLFFILPIFLEADKILELWLDEVPEHTSSFLRLILLISIITPLENPIGIAKDATGHIKKYSIVSSLLQSTIIVFDYIALKMGCSPEIVFVIQFVVLAFTLFVKFMMVRKDIGLSLRQYLVQVWLRIALVTVVASTAPVLLYITLDDTILSFFIVCGMSVVSVLSTVFIIGLNKPERNAIMVQIRRILKK